MNKFKEQVWVDSHMDCVPCFYEPLDEKSVSYTRTDVAQAMVAAAYDAARKAAFHACKSAGSGYVDENERLLQRAENEFRLEVVKAIRALTPTDAKAALDRIVQEVVKEALQVKPLVWIESEGFLEGQFVWSYDDNQSMWIVKNRDSAHYTLCESVTIEFAPISPVLGSYETLEEAKSEAEKRHTRRILSALKGGEA